SASRRVELAHQARTRPAPAQATSAVVFFAREAPLAHLSSQECQGQPASDPWRHLRGGATVPDWRQQRTVTRADGARPAWLARHRFACAVGLALAVHLALLALAAARQDTARTPGSV